MINNSAANYLISFTFGTDFGRVRSHVPQMLKVNASQFTVTA